MTNSDAPVLAIGEVLWDCLPRGLFLGGAPLNVTIHLRQLGRLAQPVSAVGQDFLGQEIQRRVAAWDIACDFMPQIVDYPTGVVQVELENGQPSYTIVEDVAWDAIPNSAALNTAVTQAPAFIYGTLAARTTGNRDLIQKLLDQCQGLRIFDVNFRSPYDDHDLVWQWAQHTDVLKVNDQEMAELLGLEHAPEQPEAIEQHCRDLRQRAGCGQILLTAGALGAGLLTADGSWHWVSSQPITVADAVGAGDSFTAAVIDGLLAHKPPRAVLTRAARLAEFVASSDGATPDHQKAPEQARHLAD